VSANYDRKREHLSLSLPGGVSVEGPADDLGEAVTVNIFGTDVTGRVLKDLRWELALSQLFKQSVRLVRADDGFNAVDEVNSLSIISTASIEELAKLGEKGGDARRFRMFLEIGGCTFAHEEDEWAGRVVRVGDAEIRVAEAVPRCEATTRNPDSGVVDYNTLKAIASYRGKDEKGKIMMGMYGNVVKQGKIRVNDALVLLD